MKLPGLPRGPASPLLASALLLALAFPPFHLLAPSFLALVPLALWVARLPPGAEGRSEALRGGFLTGLVFYSLLLYWLLVALVFYTPLAVLAFVLPVLALAGILAVATLGMHQAVARLGWPVWLALPVFWTAAEWLRAQLGDVAFPWMQLGDSLTGFPWAIGAADLVGSRGLSFWLALANGLAAEAILRWRPAWLARWIPAGAGREAGADARDAGRAAPTPARRGRGGAWQTLAALALVVAVPLGYSLYRWRTLKTESVARVAVLQPNIPEDLKLDPWAAVDSTVRSIRTLAREEVLEGAEPVDLVVLPEATFPLPVDSIHATGYTGLPRLKRWMADLARRADARILYGATGVENVSREAFRHFNSAYLVDASGRRVARYDKRRLVPVIERVPFVDPAWFQGAISEALGPYFGGATPGSTEAPMSTDGASFGVLVCYESIFTELSRDYRRAGADFLVNATNDAWYGREGPWWSRTSALWQHPAHMVMRAVENRVGVVRSANTGISLMVDPRGRVSHRTRLFEPAAFRATVYTTPGRTLYSRLGDLLGWGAALAVLGVAVASGWSLRGRRGAG